jgi:hypothetical protein
MRDGVSFGGVGVMTEADKIVAAIFAANLCSGKNCDRTTYLQTYDDFINLMKEREKEKHKTPPITDKMLKRSAEPRRRKL